MKRKMLAIVAIMMMVTSVASADLSGEAEAHVFVDVVANVSVGVLTSNVDLGQIQTGSFPANLVFRVDANVEQVKFTVIATDLYKGDDPASLFTIPVAGDGAVVQPTNANPIQGGTNLLVWLAGDGSLQLNGMSATQSETKAYESGQNQHFSQDVDVTVEYDQIDPELPRGEYSGWVKLVCEIDPV
ncbi:MAG: hypothetical protein JW806_00550 [Sedimentisphaerales bacterium]|nr:hypothetical protein [Sedimentisphaerales bacterium]